jgi:hypothetical protein
MPASLRSPISRSFGHLTATRASATVSMASATPNAAINGNQDSHTAMRDGSIGTRMMTDA